MILLTGATGYVGGRLLKRFEAEGVSLRCMARRPEYLRSRAAGSTEVVAGDALDAESMQGVFEGVETAFYLIHSMGSSGSFEEEDRLAARQFAEAAKQAGVQRIVYLGGLGDDAEDLSAHLRSRHETGAVLAEAGVPVIEFRASIVIGAGSLSFEMIRALVQKLPVMTAPRWVNVKAQPIAVDDLLAYLMAAVDQSPEGHEVVEVGGSDVVSYQDLMLEYARQRGLKRRIIPVPVLTPYLSSLWLGLVTPLFARIGRNLIGSLTHASVVCNPAPAARYGIECRGVGEAIAQALEEDDRSFRESHWSDSLASADGYRKWGGVRFGTRLVDSRSQQLDLPVEQAFGPVTRIGGETGWYFGNALWQLRGFIDLLVGGVGMRRGRRDAQDLREGDVLDCWRVEKLEAGRCLRLSAEMKMPGRAWLEFSVEPEGEGCRIHQTAIFDPVGLGGLLYWYGVYPLHQVVFSGMLRGLVREAQKPEGATKSRV